jgi:hypothetical protein
MKKNSTMPSETGIRGMLALTLKIPPRPDDDAPAGGPQRPDLMAEGRRRVLAHLADQGASSVAEMPRAWPVSKFLLRMAAAQLIARGLVEPVPVEEGGTRGVLRLTAQGAREALSAPQSPRATPLDR